MRERIIWHRLLSVGFSDPGKYFSGYDSSGIFSAKKGDLILCQNRIEESYLEKLTDLGFLTNQVRYLEDLSVDVHDPRVVATSVKQNGFVSTTHEVLDPFIATPFEKELAKELSVSIRDNVEQVCNRDTKSDFINTVGHCVTVPKSSVTVEDSLRFRLTLLTFLLRGNVVLKEDFGVAGEGMKVITRTKPGLIFSKDLLDSLKRVRSCYGRQSDERSVVVQEWIQNITCSPSVQLMIEKGGNVVVRSLHIQKFYPNTYSYAGCLSESWVDVEIRGKLRKEAEKIGNKYYASGYFGLVGLNAVVTSKGDVYWVEANLRRVLSSVAFDFVSSLYPEKIAERLFYIMQAVTVSKQYRGNLPMLIRDITPVLLGRNKGGCFPILLHTYEERGEIFFLFVSERDQRECIDMYNDLTDRVS